LGGILHDENGVLRVPSLSDDSCGVKDICLRICFLLKGNGIFRPVRIDLDETESHIMRASADSLKEFMKT